jgi:phosphatidylserine/phosphatidylglycerophosphate/cardiolipin synthase-like enzyme
MTAELSNRIKRTVAFSISFLLLISSFFNASAMEGELVEGNSQGDHPHTITQVSPAALNGIFSEASIRNNAFFHFTKFLSRADKEQLREVNKKCRDFIDLTYFGPVYDPAMRVIPFSSEISGGRIGTHIFTLLEQAQRSIIIASDQCTNEEFLDDLSTLQENRQLEGRPLDIFIVTGEHPGTKKALNSKPRSFISLAVPSNNDSARSGKMHNKFIIVDKDFVITGSPNLTFAAYNYNIESFVAIYHQFVAKLYFHYYQYIISGARYDYTREEYRHVQKLMHIFNTAPDNPIRVCLAPILDIKTFVIGELNASQDIDINMFLISRASAAVMGDDIVANLLAAHHGGAGVTIKVDYNQYEQTTYMSSALAPLQTVGANIYTVLKHSEGMQTKTKTIVTKPQFHDKLLLIKQREDDSKKVIIGSAGFTDNVQDNLNLENMVLIKVPEVYDFLLDHFNSINDSITSLDVKKI